MADALDNTLLIRILQQLQEGQPVNQAALTRVERAVVLHDRKFAEAELRFSYIEKRLNDVQASIRDVADKLEFIIKLEIGGIAATIQSQFGRRVSDLEDGMMALEQGRPPS